MSSEPGVQPLDFKAMTHAGHAGHWETPTLSHYGWEDPLVDGLSPHEQGVIFILPEGLLYTNQSGGHCCEHPTARGRMLTVPYPDDKVVDAIENHLYTAHKGWCAPASFWGIKDGECGELFTLADADTIDKLLAASDHLKGLTVDRARIAESMEAWIYANYNGHPCVIVTGNSD